MADAVSTDDERSQYGHANVLLQKVTTNFPSAGSSVPTCCVLCEEQVLSQPLAATVNTLHEQLYTVPEWQTRAYCRCTIRRALQSMTMFPICMPAEAALAQDTRRFTLQAAQAFPSAAALEVNYSRRFGASDSPCSSSLGMRAWLSEPSSRFASTAGLSATVCSLTCPPPSSPASTTVAAGSGRYGSE